ALPGLVIREGTPRSHLQTRSTTSGHTQDRAAYVAPSKRTTGAFLREDWLPGLRAQVRPGTWAEHKSKVEVHLVPAIGGVRLQQLTPGHLNALYADLLEQGLADRTGPHVPAPIRRHSPTQPVGA